MLWLHAPRRLPPWPSAQHRTYVVSAGVIRRSVRGSPPSKVAIGQAVSDAQADLRSPSKEEKAEGPWPSAQHRAYIVSPGVIRRSGRGSPPDGSKVAIGQAVSDAQAEVRSPSKVSIDFYAFFFSYIPRYIAGLAF